MREVICAAAAPNRRIRRPPLEEEAEAESEAEAVLLLLSVSLSVLLSVSLPPESAQHTTAASLTAWLEQVVAPATTVKNPPRSHGVADQAARGPPQAETCAAPCSSSSLVQSRAPARSQLSTAVEKSASVSQAFPAAARCGPLQTAGASLLRSHPSSAQVLEDVAVGASSMQHRTEKLAVASELHPESAFFPAYQSALFGPPPMLTMCPTASNGAPSVATPRRHLHGVEVQIGILLSLHPDPREARFCTSLSEQSRAPILAHISTAAE